MQGTVPSSRYIAGDSATRESVMSRHFWLCLVLILSLHSVHLARAVHLLTKVARSDPESSGDVNGIIATIFLLLFLCYLFVLITLALNL